MRRRLRSPGFALKLNDIESDDAESELERDAGKSEDINARVSRGSSVAEDPAEGHVSFMIPYVHYRKVQAYLKAIESRLIVHGLWIQHNFVKPTTSQYLIRSSTAQTAGFDIELNRPWTQLIALAERVALLGHIPTPMQAGLLAVQAELDRWLPSPNPEQPIPAPDPP